MNAMKKYASIVLLAVQVQAQAGFNPPVAERCPGLSSLTNVVCVNNYAAVLPYPFSRIGAIGTGGNRTDSPNDTFIDTSVPSDPSFELLPNASFVVFDQTRGLNILGSSPRVDFIFNTIADSIHEAPVYVPGLNAIIYSLPHQGIYEQQIINLNGSSPTISNYTTNPPVYAVNGGKLYNGMIYWAVEASFSFPSPSNGSLVQQTPGIYRLDPYTGQVTTLLNNYYGKLFNSPNDLWIDSRGDVWFTDSWYGYAINVTSYPVLAPATYRFRPSTGSVNIVEDTLQQPNGIGVSPDGRTMYLTDTGFTDFTNPPPPNVLPKYSYNPLGARNVYAYDVNYAPPGNYLTNKRVIWTAETGGDDGFHVSREGYLIGAAGNGADILDTYGELIMRIEVNVTINNIQFAGVDRRQLWLFGDGAIYRVSLSGLQGVLQE